MCSIGKMPSKVSDDYRIMRNTVYRVNSERANNSIRVKFYVIPSIVKRINKSIENKYRLWENL